MKFTTKMNEYTTPQGYKLKLKKWKQNEGDTLENQTSFRNMSVFNTKGTSSEIAQLYPDVIEGTDERRHTIYSNPAHSVAAGLGRLWFYEQVANGETAQGTWWVDYLKTSHLHAQNTTIGGVSSSISTSFRTAICVFTPPDDYIGSRCNLVDSSECKYNNPNWIVNKVAKRLLIDGYDFDPDNRALSSYFNDSELLPELVEEWANFESAVIWDARVYIDGIKIFQYMLRGERLG